MSSLAQPILDPEIRPGSPPTVTASPGGTAADWVTGHREALRTAVVTHGSLMVRGLPLHDAAGAAAVFAGLGTGLMTERESFAPRTELSPGVYSSTTWPARQPMCMHHELSYLLEVPGLMMFACLRAPESGGVTGVADAAAVLADLPGDLADRFARQGWQLVRTYSDDIGASWEQAFGTDDRAAVERYCAANTVEHEWLPDGGLRTRQRRAAVVTHPVTGRRCWFNQVSFLSEWTMDEEVREFLVEEYGADNLPFTTRFGDGEPIGADVVALVNEVYDQHTRREPWQAGDLLVVDNVATAHSREPYTGSREVVVAMTDAARPAELFR